MFLIITIFITSCSSQKSDFSSNVAMMNKSSEDIKADIAVEADISIPDSQKKIIKNANVFIETENASEAHGKLYDKMSQLGGYEFSRSNNQVGDSISIDLVVKIPSESLDNFLKFLEECGDIKSLNISANDITDQYVDTEIRLDSTKRSLEKYYEFLQNTQNVEEMLKVQAEINRLTAEIEAAEGKINLWNKQVSESSVDITIREKTDPSRYKNTIKWNSMSFLDMGNLIKYGFVSVSGTIVSILQWLIVIIISCLPILLIGAAVIVVIKVLKKHRK